MPKFRKKPVEIEAVQWNGDNLNEVADLTADADNIHIAGTLITIRTLEGVMTCSLGDWIVKGVKGEFYPVKPDIFIETYEPV